MTRYALAALGGGSVKLGELLEKNYGCAFKGENGEFLPYNTEITNTNAVTNVSIAACPHDSVTGSTCDYCGAEYLVAAYYLYENGEWAVNGLFVAESAEGMNDKANVAFGSWNGGMLRLFTDVKLDDRTITKAYAKAIDLNGHTITGGTLTIANGNIAKDQTLTITDSSTGKAGSFANVTVNGGSSLTVDGVKVGSVTLHAGCTFTDNGGFYGSITAADGKLIDFLLEGYAFADADTGEVVNGYVKTLTNVKVVAHTHGDYKWDTATHEKVCACGFVCKHTGGTPGYFKKAVCSVCRTEYGVLLTDTTAPTGSITINERNAFKTFINKITFGLFFNEDVTAVITAQDDSYNHVGYDSTLHAVKVEYLVSRTALTETELRTMSFSAYGKAISLSDEQDYVVYAKLTDWAGNVTYLSTDGFAIDKIAPTGTITINECTPSKDFITDITFDSVFKDDVTVKLTARDNGSGVKSLAYYKSTKVLSLAEVKAITDWTEGDSFVVTAEVSAQFVVYARIEDNAGNVTYLSSEGVDIDVDAPSIIGVENGKTYYVTQKVTIADKHLKTITFNGIQVTSPFTLVGNTNADYVIVATDELGNTTTFTIHMQPISVITDTIKGITVDNVKLTDREKVEAVAEQLKLIADAADKDAVISEEEQNILATAIENCDGLQKRIGVIDNAEKVIEEIKNLPSVDDVKLSDKAEVERVKKLVDSLSEDEKALLDEESLSKVKALNEWLARVDANADTDKPASTGDAENIALWLALLFVSGGVVVGVTSVGKKKKRED